MVLPRYRRFPLLSAMRRHAAVAACAAAGAIATAEARLGADGQADDEPHAFSLVQSQRAASSSSTRTPLSDDEVQATEAYKIICQFKTPKDIRISVRGEYWERLPNLQGTRLTGTIVQWIRKEPPDRKIKVIWPDGHDIELLNDLFHPDVDLRFERYADDRAPPRLTGRAAAREAREREEQERAHAEQVVIQYIDGGEPKEQVWVVERPEAVTADQRTEEWKKPKLNRDLKTLNTPYRMWQRAALPLELLTKLRDFCNQRLDGESNEYDSRHTTVGELLQFFAYMGTIAIERGCASYGICVVVDR